MKSKSARRGFTLAELAIALALMSFLVLLALSMVKLTSIGVVGTEMKTTIIREDAAFAAKLSDTIQKSTVAFTIPTQSFNDKTKLTAEWNYLGLMKDVHIPAFCSRTGKEIDKANALVYIEYVGTTPPASIPADCNLLDNGSGAYFLQRILGHDFTDTSGVTHTYSLELKPTDPTQKAAQTIIYEFKSALTDAAGDPVGTGADIEIEEMLNCLNSIQVVYKGSSFNPAVALSFRSDFIPPWAATQAATTKTAATVVLVLDTSGSMGSSFERTTRILALQDNATTLVEQLSTNDKINVIVVPFSTYAAYSSSFSAGHFTFNANTDKLDLLDRISSMTATGNTNLGDGLRVAYYELGNLVASGAETGPIFLVMMTDGAMNQYSKTADGTSALYEGSKVRPPAYAYGESKARNYARLWGEKWTTDYTLEQTWLLSLNKGMSTADKEVLEETFGTEPIDITNLTQFQEIFESIGNNIEEVIWAFEGPNL